MLIPYITCQKQILYIYIYICANSLYDAFIEFHFLFFFFFGGGCLVADEGTMTIL